MRLTQYIRSRCEIYLILIIGFLLRVYRLDGPSLWFDELLTLGSMDLPLIQIVKGAATLPFPPLYHIVTHLWVKTFGISEFSLRFPSLIFSLLSIFLIFKLAKELFGRQVGLLAALLLVISPYSIGYAREAKMYSMLWFFGLLSFYFFYKFTRDNKKRDLALYILSTLASIYTLYAGLFFIIVQNAVFFLLFFRRPQLKKWLLAQAIIILLYLP
ncbi:MAG: glycosyltransferase family 39 protein, partial [Candidatus Omnitrophota bacterium]